MEQRELDFLEEERNRRAGDGLLRVVHDVYENIGLKTLADACLISQAAISQGCSGAEGRGLNARVVAVAARLDPQRRVGAYIAGLTHHVLTPRQVLTPEQENDALKRALRNVLGPEAAALVLKHAGVDA